MTVVMVMPNKRKRKNRVVVDRFIGPAVDLNLILKSASYIF